MRIKLNRRRVKKAIDYFDSEKGVRNIPYKFGNKVINWFCHTEYARQKHFSRKHNLFTEFVSQLDPQLSADDFIPDVYISNFLKGWRAASISSMSEKKFRNIIKITGQEEFDRINKSGKGIVLVSSHYGLAELTVSLIPRLGYENFTTIVLEKGSTSLKFKGLDKKYEPNLLIFKDHSNEELFKQLFKAKQILNKGGIVHILGDGYHGKSNKNINFLGKIRGVRPSFAELGITTSSAIIPIFNVNNPDGSISITFEKPLDFEVIDGNHEEKVNFVVDSFFELLANRWKEKPQLVNWGYMDKYIRLIPAGIEEG